jgi:hypothetical protein
MQPKHDIDERKAHVYFRGAEERHAKGSGLEVALDEMAERRRKTDALRAARQAAELEEATATHSIGGAGTSSS